MAELAVCFAEDCKLSRDLGMKLPERGNQNLPRALLSRCVPAVEPLNADSTETGAKAKLIHGCRRRAHFVDLERPIELSCSEARHAPAAAACC